MNYAEINECSVADGDGCRVVLYCSGCRMNCEGCHNPQAWDFNYGKEFTEDTMRELIKALSKPYIRGLTLSGGHPLDEKNLPVINKIVEENLNGRIIIVTHSNFIRAAIRNAIEIPIENQNRVFSK